MRRVGTFCFAHRQKRAAELSAYEDFVPDAPGKEQEVINPTKVNLLSWQQQFQPLLGNKQKRWKMGTHVFS